MFYDSKEGSPEEALRAAIIHRHKILASRTLATKIVHPRSLPLDPSKRIKRRDEPGRKQRYVYWKATWYDKNHGVKSQNFSVNQYGESGAKALALAAAEKNHNRKPKLTTVPDPYRSRTLKVVLRADVEVLSKVNSPYSRNAASGGKSPVSDDPFAFEGERKMALHLEIERKRSFRDRKVREFVVEHGRVFCEVCDFNFSDAYPFLDSDIIEVHHVVPLGTLTKATRVRMCDLMLLCSNCHFAIHQGDSEENLILALDHYGK